MDDEIKILRHSMCDLNCDIDLYYEATLQFPDSRVCLCLLR